MHLIRILTATLFTLCVMFLGFQVLELEVEAAGVRMFLVLLLTLLYFLKVESKNLFFLLFLLFFSLAEIFSFTSYFVEIDYSTTPDYFYYLVNGLYIVSYVFLIFRILRDMDLKDVIKKFWIHLTILIFLDVFCVIILSGTMEKKLNYSQFSLELLYNSVIMILLTVAMINYMSKNTLKSMNLLLAAIFIFFSEVIQMTYFYIANITVLNVLCSLFLILAFLFLYLQARIMTDTNQNGVNQDFRV